MINKEKEYIEFTKICGDCGRRFKMKFEMPNFKQTKKGQKEMKKFVDFFFVKYNVSCNQCSKKKVEQGRKK